MKHLLITYDYELFLGKRSGTVTDCMTSPSDALLEVMRPFGIRSVFFVDTTCLLTLKESTDPRCKSDFEQIADQLRKMVSEGHYVFPHIHPHWLDAVHDPETHQWDLSNTAKYLFRNISEAERQKVFAGSVQLLQEILAATSPDYRVTGYRAGGWGIQPFTFFRPYFEQYGILYDFSVLSRFYQFTDAQYFDFSDAPEKHVYRFSDDVCKEDPSGPFIQFSIDSVKTGTLTSVLDKIWIKYLYKVQKDHTFHKGAGQPSRTLAGTAPKSPKGIELGSPGLERIAVESLTSVRLPSYRRHLDEQDYMHFLSHPKMITRHNIKTFKRFLENAFHRHVIETDFMKMIPFAA